jgi:hypothetical protein
MFDKLPGLLNSLSPNYVVRSDELSHLNDFLLLSAGFMTQGSPIIS